MSSPNRELMKQGRRRQSHAQRLRKEALASDTESRGTGSREAKEPPPLLPLSSLSLSLSPVAMSIIKIFASQAKAWIVLLSRLAALLRLHFAPHAQRETVSRRQADAGLLMIMKRAEAEDPEAHESRNSFAESRAVILSPALIPRALPSSCFDCFFACM